MKLWPRRTPKVDRLQRKGDAQGLREAATYTDRLIDRSGRVVDQGAPVRAAAVRALSEHASGPEGEPHLDVYATCLRDDSAQVSVAAAEALGAIGSQEAAWALVDALAERTVPDDPQSCATLLEAVRACGGAGVSERWCRTVLDTRPDRLEEADREDLMALIEADSVADPLRAMFLLLAPHLNHAPGASPRSAAATAILRWCMPASVPGLAELLRSPGVPEAAVRLAGDSGDQSLIDPLVQLLEHPRPGVRSQAATALGALCDTDAVMALMGATTDSDIAVRKSAVAALDEMGSAGITAALTFLAHATSRGRLEGQAPRSALNGDTWSRTLARLGERTGFGVRVRRRIARDGPARRYAGLIEARARYESLIADRARPPPASDG